MSDKSADSTKEKKYHSRERIFAVMKSSPDMKEIHECIHGRKDSKVCYTHNHRFGKKHINLVAGDFFVSKDDVVVSTVLGSCIAVCLYSDFSPYCGMNHFMLPQAGERYKNEKDIMHTDAAFYGINSMEMMMNALYKVGIKKEQLKAKVFGGGNVLKFNSAEATVGEKNVEFALRFLETEKIPVTACSVGGDYARKVIFFIKSKEILMAKISKTLEHVVAEEEKTLHHRRKIKKDVSIFTDR
ncbi:MAG: chemotaxis protein CheD [Spirochaetes bacterium]|nr:chemotaxis protein CheD [Spirochaetota bacterium]